ncbi:MAG: glycoside hydrolase family 32 protein [Flavobacteriaceae bacterium]|nr:glycoside hydrolase family 32 protein [Flavobacteriaceae bacterium]
MRKIFITILVFFISCEKKEVGYNEKFRPQFHFSPKLGWMNDPNGMFYINGDYHLFYQYYPDDNVWGPMHWGHAVSKDLIHWKNEPIAIYPDGNNYIFSGSAIVDQENKSGLGNGVNPPILAYYTNHDMLLERFWNGSKDSLFIDVETQHLAYSQDLGKTWVKYNNNPVIKNPGYRDYRDPKVTWLKEQEKWIISLAARDRIMFYSSKNLIEWEYLSDFKNIGERNGVWECPDLFPLIDENGNKKWILFVSINKNSPNGGSGTQYFIGDFDGESFKIDDNFLGDNNSIWIDYGSDNYAGVTWNNTPNNFKSRKFIGWMSNWRYGQVVPTFKWRSAMTIPRNISLYLDEEKRYRIKFNPISLEKIVSKSNSSHNKKNKIKISGNQNRFFISDISSNEFDIKFSNNEEDLSIKFSSNTFEIDRSNFNYKSINPDPKRTYKKEIFENSFIKNQTAKYNSEVKSIEIILDKSSIELFINDGELVMTDVFFYNNEFQLMELSGLNDFKIEEQTLNSIW